MQSPRNYVLNSWYLNFVFVSNFDIRISNLAYKHNFLYSKILYSLTGSKLRCSISPVLAAIIQGC